MTIETDPSKVSPQTHAYIGLYREPWESVHGRYCKALYEKRQTGEKMPGVSIHSPLQRGPSYYLDDTQLRLEWLAGHFDIPQYKLIDEKHKQDAIDADAFRRAHERRSERPIYTGATCPGMEFLYENVGNITITARYAGDDANKVYFRDSHGSSHAVDKGEFRRKATPIGDNPPMWWDGLFNPPKPMEGTSLEEAARDYPEKVKALKEALEKMPSPSQTIDAMLDDARQKAGLPVEDKSPEAKAAVLYEARKWLGEPPEPPPVQEKCPHCGSVAGQNVFGRCKTCSGLFKEPPKQQPPNDSLEKISNSLFHIEQEHHGTLTNPVLLKLAAIRDRLRALEGSWLR